MKTRNYIIDAFRGVAVLLVTSFHIFLWSSSGGLPLGNYFDLYGPFGNGWIGVGIFFVISGYCMGMSTRNMFSNGVSQSSYFLYFSKRFLRIAIPYYISILFWIVLIRCYGVAEKPTGIYDILTHMTFIHNLNESTMFSISGVYWSLAVEMQFYLLLPIFVLICKTDRNRIILLAICAVSSIVINLITVDRVLTWSIISYLYLFVLGWVLFVSSDCGLSFRKLKAIRISSIVALVVMLFYKGDGFNNNIKLYEIVASTFAAISMWSFVVEGKGNVNPTIVVRLLSFVGKCSFSIYLYNYVFWVIPRESSSMLISMLSFCFVIAFGIAMYFIVENPSERFRKNFFSVKSKQVTT